MDGLLAISDTKFFASKVYRALWLFVLYLTNQKLGMEIAPPASGDISLKNHPIF